MDNFAISVSESGMLRRIELYTSRGGGLALFLLFRRRSTNHASFPLWKVSLYGITPQDVPCCCSCKGHVVTSTPVLCHSLMICQTSLCNFLKTFQHIFRYTMLKRRHFAKCFLYHLRTFCKSFSTFLMGEMLQGYQQ